jgi:predicted GIY-YIG superfamily endonuclease
VNGSIIEFMPWVYILRCADDSYYVGSADDLEGRINQRAIGDAGGVHQTAPPLTLAWAQECENIGEPSNSSGRSKAGDATSGWH